MEKWIVKMIEHDVKIINDNKDIPYIVIPKIISNLKYINNISNTETEDDFYSDEYIEIKINKSMSDTDKIVAIKEVINNIIDKQLTKYFKDRDEIINKYKEIKLK